MSTKELDKHLYVQLHRGQVRIHDYWDADYLLDLTGSAVGDILYLVMELEGVTEGELCFMTLLTEVINVGPCKALNNRGGIR